MQTEKLAIKHRFSGAVLFECNVDVSLPLGLRLGFAVKAAIKARANLAGANLARAYLAGANLARANLADADLAGANLARAYLAGANLARANLADANLAGANLARAYLAGVQGIDKQPPQTVLLPAGDLIGWKKLEKGIIAKLSIPAAAKRVNSTGRKCRAEYVTTLALYNEIGGIATSPDVIGIGQHDGTTEYRVGKVTKPDKFDDDWRVECSHGIHFFITREEAEAY